jgi:hypothetical protein
MHVVYGPNGCVRKTNFVTSLQLAPCLSNAGHSQRSGISIAYAVNRSATAVRPWQACVKVLNNRFGLHGFTPSSQSSSIYSSQLNQ